MNVEPLQLFRSRRSRPQSGADLVSCSICLRVRRGSEWVEAEHVIREIRSYELQAAPHLHSAVCDICAESILSRRAQGEAVAA